MNVLQGQNLLWYAGVKSGAPGTIALASSFKLPAAVLFAFMILGEIPGAGQLLGASLIMVNKPTSK